MLDATEPSVHISTLAREVVEPSREVVIAVDVLSNSPTTREVAELSGELV